MSDRISLLERKIAKRVGQRDLLLKQYDSLKSELSEKLSRKEDIEKAQIIIQTTAQETQQQLEYHISELVTLAMDSVFPNPYKIKLDFDLKRDKTEANIWFVDDEGNKIDPMDASGGGAVDVASLALQISLWTLSNPRTRNVLILDEPLKWLKGGELPERGAALIKEISKRLKIQIIMVSHSTELIESADAVFRVSKKGGVSKVTRV